MKDNKEQKNKIKKSYKTELKNGLFDKYNIYFKNSDKNSNEILILEEKR